MPKVKSISQLVDELQISNEKLSYLDKLFNQAVRHEFGYSCSDIHNIISRYEMLQRKHHVDNNAGS